MKCELRRKEIVNILSVSNSPVSAGVFSEKFGVSRQIIVKDIAKIRENGVKISSFARGYMLTEKNRCTRVFKVKHTDDDVEQELNLIVDFGGMVEDVFIYHKVYGVVKARMDIKSRNDVSAFLENIKSGKSSLLKNVTAGYHYHTVSANTEEVLDIIAENLQKTGFTAPLQKYEPSVIK